jgi:hypothetical protein
MEPDDLNAMVEAWIETEMSRIDEQKQKVAAYE